MLEAFYYDGKRAERHIVALQIRDGQLWLDGPGVAARHALAEVDFGEPLCGTARCIEMADGSRCEVGDAAGLAVLLDQAGRGDSLVVRLQKRWRWAIASLLVVVAGSLAGYFWGLPAAARYLAPKIPEAVVRQISTTVLAQLDQSHFKSSRLPAEAQQAIRERAAHILSGPGLPAWRLHFRASPRLGANAFALPSGDIVVLDELVDRLDAAQLNAVLAHEVGHLAGHHALRRMIQGAAVSLVLAAWFGDVSSSAVGISAFLLQSGYSREAEREADAYAVHHLLRCCASAEPLAEALAKLDERTRPSGAALFSSHPDTGQRIQAIRSRKP